MNEEKINKIEKITKKPHKENKEDNSITFFFFIAVVCLVLILGLINFTNGYTYISNQNIAANLTEPIDAYSGALEIIDYEHHEIHAGSHFYVCGFTAEPLELNEELNFSFHTPSNGKEAHMTFYIKGTSQTELYIYENYTFSGGTTTTIFNNDRNSNKTSNSSVSMNSVLDTTSVTTLILSESEGFAGATPSRADFTALVDRNRELILKQNTGYLFNIVSKDNDNIVSYCGEWYEHTPRD